MSTQRSALTRALDRAYPGHEWAFIAKQKVDFNYLTDPVFTAVWVDGVETWAGWYDYQLKIDDLSNTTTHLTERIVQMVGSAIHEAPLVDIEPPGDLPEGFTHNLHYNGEFAYNGMNFYGA